ncbi:MAG: hypothetical protein ACU0CA_07320 [Paracoccaceae bacterium]
MVHFAGMLKKLDNVFLGIEWKLSLGSFVWAVLFPVGSFAVTSWATRAAGVFSQYAPLSWIVAGFVGLLIYALSVFLYGVGQSRTVRSKYDANFLLETGGVDPLSKVFEGKRIYLNDFILPSNPIVEGKNFVDCEIVGPANIYLGIGNSINDVKPFHVDAVALSGKNDFTNAYNFHNCTFRNCTFHRVTLFFHPEEVPKLQHLDWLNWITVISNKESLPSVIPASQIEDQSDQSPKEIEEEKPR